MAPLRQVATILGALSLTVQGFLIPPSINADVVAPEGIEFEPAFKSSTKSQVIKIDCPGCGLDVNAKDVSLMVNLAVMNNNPDILELHGVQIYPAQIFPRPLFATAVPSTVSEDDFAVSLAAGVPQSANIRLGYELSIGAEVKGPDGDALIPVKFHIVEVENKFVQGLPILDIKLFRTSKNSLFFRVDKTEVAATPSTPAAAPKECQALPLLCKWKAAVAETVAAAKTKIAGKPKPKGCHKARPHYKAPGRYSPNKASSVAESAGEKLPTHHRHGHHHHKAHRFGHWKHQIKRVIAHVLLPVLIGIVAGVGASLLGMLAGQCMVMVYRHFKYGSCAYKRVSVEEVEEVEESYPEDEKRLLGDDGLPQYDDVVEELPHKE